MEEGSIGGKLLVLAFAFILLGVMYVTPVLAEDDSSTKCTCVSEPKICPQYSTDTSCVDRLPHLASPLDGNIATIANQNKYYRFGDDWYAGSYCNGKPKKHVGVDLGVEFVQGKDIPVYAAAAGTVRAVYLCSSTHNWAHGIAIDHDGAFTTVYEHVNSLVTEGQRVGKGQKIATVAQIEGYQHLHFGIKCGGYDAISKRGALPVEHGDCDFTAKCELTGCKCDPLFPGAFIDPLDPKIIYEEPAAQSNPEPATSNYQGSTPAGASVDTQQNLNLPTIPSESALSTTPILDGSSANTPTTVHECETHGLTFCGTWTLEGNRFKAAWINGAVATLTIDHWGPADVVISRIDPSGVSTGLSARYEGQINGNEIENGKVTWTWLGFTWSGTWNANW
jgi:hypothetical protein